MFDSGVYLVFRCIACIVLLLSGDILEFEFVIPQWFIITEVYR